MRTNSFGSRFPQISAFTVMLLGICASQGLKAQVVFTGSYSENFNDMSSTSTTPPVGWSVVSEAGSHNTFAPAGSSTVGVAPNFTAGALTTQATLTAATPTQGSTAQRGLGGYNWANTLATAANGEGARSLGSSPSGNAATILELSLVNSTGSSISAVNLSYDIDRFTTISNTNGSASGYPNTGVEEYPGYQLFYNLTPGNNTTWVNVSALNPTIDAGTSGNVSVPNTVGITAVPTTTINLSGTWSSGSTIQFAWLDDNAESPSPDQLIGLNNVSIVAAPEPQALALLAAGAVSLMAVVRRGRRVQV